MNYYVYYKLDAGRVEALRPLVKELFRKIQDECSVRGRWMRRRDDPSTYMEVYEGVGDEQEFEALLDREARSLRLERKVERFVCA